MSGPFQIGLSDVVTVIKTAIWIKEHCFTQENRADRRYRELKDQIERFTQALRRFDEVSRRRPARILSLNGKDIGPADFGQGYDLDLPGFKLTLEDCKKLLKKYPALNDERSSRIGDALWHIRAEPKATDLRNRLQAHSDHILIQLGLLNLDFAYEHSQSHDDLRDILRSRTSVPQVEPGPRLTDSLETSFRAALRISETYGISANSLHLPEAVKVAHQHLIRSNPDSDENQASPRSTTNQCLSLLKAKWLLKLVENSEAFRREPQQSTNRHWITYTMTTTIPQRSRLPQFMTVSEEAIQAEFESDPEIWIVEPVAADPERQDSNFNIRNTLEKHIATVKLPTGEMRITQVDDRVLRLDPARIVYFNLNSDYMVPWYTFNSQAGITLKSAMNIPAEIFNFKSRAHKLRMQAAFVEYEVCKPTETWDGVRVTVTSQRGMTFHQDNEIGEVQLWTWPSKSNTQIGGSILSSNRSFSSESRTDSMATAVTGGLNPTLFTYQAGESEKGGAIFAKLPPPPLLVCFTREKEVYSMWRVDRKCADS